MLQEHAAIIAEEFNVTKRRAAAALRLFGDGASVPFISRYRKEMTGSMDAATLRNIQLRNNELNEIDERRAFILKSIKEQKALTPELRERIEQTYNAALLEDIYMPYKTRRKTRAAAARELGLTPLAEKIKEQTIKNVENEAQKYLNSEIISVPAAIAGATDIIAEMIAEDEKARGIVRAKFQRSGIVNSRLARGVKAEEAINFQNYFDFSEPVRSANSHRYLAMRLGEDEGFLKVSINIDDTEMTDRLNRMFIRNDATDDCAAIMRQAVAEGYRRLIRPSIETEIAQGLKEKSDEAAISYFTENVEQLLMQPPLGPNHRVLAIDPGFKNGCKLAVLDATGTVLDCDVIYPNAPANDFYGASQTICFLIDRYAVDVIALGNATAARETERFLSELQLPRPVSIKMVSEQGASIYSVSQQAEAEMPELDVTIRSAVSIGRRLIDALSELVKIDPKSIGVGQYQHDVNQPRLRDALNYTIEKCVNNVGVNLNTASAKLLSYVSGIGPGVAENIVAYRNENGPFKSRFDLLEVPRMGQKTFQQCAAFLRIPNGENPLDNTAIHPESYSLVFQIANDMNVAPEKLFRNKLLLQSIELDRYVTRQVGLPTLELIVKELSNPGEDPRVTDDEEVAKSIYNTANRSIEDLHLGMILTGKINNITAFGAFVDIGLKVNGLIHISQMTDNFINSPSEVVKLGEIVKVKIIDIDVVRGRIALTMKI